MVVSDPGVIAAGITDKVRERIEAEGIETVLFDDVHVEPTSDSLQAAADFAVDGDFDGFVGIGGGSSMDTAKVADLVATHPAPIMDYVNPPIGGGRKPSSPLKPLVMVPTTSGTGSEATSVAVLDIPDQHVKSGISHRYLRPHQGIVDPDLTKSLPKAVTASTGLDVVCHAAESFISRPYDTRDRPESPDDRPPYQGSNPIADLWSAKALELGGRYLRRADYLVETQREEIASLKAFGYRNSEIAIHFLGYPTAAVVIGSILGIALGIWAGIEIHGAVRQLLPVPDVRASHEYRPDCRGRGRKRYRRHSSVRCLLYDQRVSLQPAQGMLPPAPTMYRRLLVEKLGIQGFFSPAARQVVMRNIERKPLRCRSRR